MFHGNQETDPASAFVAAGPADVVIYPGENPMGVDLA
jgi:hypothetical protein